MIVINTHSIIDFQSGGLSCHWFWRIIIWVSNSQADAQTLVPGEYYWLVFCVRRLYQQAGASTSQRQSSFQLAKKLRGAWMSQKDITFMAELASTQHFPC